MVPFINGITGAAGTALPFLRKRRGEGRLAALVGSDVERSRTVRAVKGRDGIAPTIGEWVAACFPGGTAASEVQIQELIQEAADSARSDYGVTPLWNGLTGMSSHPE